MGFVRDIELSPLSAAHEVLNSNAIMTLVGGRTYGIAAAGLGVSDFACRKSH